MLVLCEGQIAGAIASALTTPLDVVKTRVLTQARFGAGAVVHTGLRNTAKKIWMEEVSNHMSLAKIRLHQPVR